MKVFLKDVRLAFPDVFTAVKIGDDPTSKPRYGALFIIEPKSENAKLLKAAVAQVAAEKWKTKAGGTVAELTKKDRICFREEPRKNKAGEVYDGFEGMFYVNATNEIRPSVINKNKSPVTAEDGIVYAGCYVNASIDVWAQDNKWGQRINSTLLGVQFSKDGDAFTAGARPDPNDFDDISEGTGASDDLA